MKGNLADSARHLRNTATLSRSLKDAGSASPLCPSHSAGLSCTDSRCRRLHLETCVFCTFLILDEYDVTMCGPHRDMPAHESCAERYYNE